MIKPALTQLTVREARLWANQAWQGVYTNQRLNLSKLWEGSQRTCQGLKPDPGNLAVRHFRGASRTVRHGETVNPPAIERAGPETPHLQRGALDLYPNRLVPRHPPTRAKSGNAETAKPFPKVARAVPLSRPDILGHQRLIRDVRDVSGTHPIAPILPQRGSAL